MKKYYIRKQDGSYNPDYPSSDSWSLMYQDCELIIFSSMKELKDFQEMLNNYIKSNE